MPFKDKFIINVIMSINDNNQMKKSKLSPYMKTRIIVYYSDDMNITTIAKKLNLNRNTVSKWINRYYECGMQGLERLPGTGTIKKKSSEDDVKVINLISENKYQSLRELKNSLTKININYSIHKIRVILNSHGYRFGIPPKHVPLTEAVKYKRLMFAIKYANFDWDKVIFTDECSIWQGLKTIKRWYNENLGVDYDVTYKHGKKLNIWAAISSTGIKEIHVFKENMDTDKYIHILRSNLLTIYNPEYFLQYDNDPKHTSSKSLTFLRKNNIKIIDFPPYSPDLNPIENIWGLLKRALLKHKNQWVTFEDHIINEWNNISKNIIANTIKSMPKRLQQIINNKGDHIEY